MSKSSKSVGLLQQICRRNHSFSSTNSPRSFFCLAERVFGFLASCSSKSSSSSTSESSRLRFLLFGPGLLPSFEDLGPGLEDLGPGLEDFGPGLEDLGPGLYPFEVEASVSSTGSVSSIGSGVASLELLGPGLDLDPFFGAALVGSVTSSGSGEDSFGPGLDLEPLLDTTSLFGLFFCAGCLLEPSLSLS